MQVMHLGGCRTRGTAFVAGVFAQWVGMKSDLENISRGTATVHVLISCVHSHACEAAPELSQLYVTGYKLVSEVVIVPHMQIVVAACDQLGTIIVQELHSHCEVCTGGGATDGISCLHIP